MLRPVVKNANRLLGTWTAVWPWSGGGCVMVISVMTGHKSLFLSQLWTIFKWMVLSRGLSVFNESLIQCFSHLAIFRCVDLNSWNSPTSTFTHLKTANLQNTSLICGPLHRLRWFEDTACSGKNSLWCLLARVDRERIQAVGPDRAASEWLLRCGASVRYHGYDKWQQDYNAIPVGPLEKYKIQAINATESCIMNRGFDYFGMLLSLTKLI